MSHSTWRWERAGCRIVDADTGHKIADVSASYTNEETLEGRGRLLGAAPDLLEALEESHRALSHYEWYAKDANGVRAANERALSLAKAKSASRE